MRALLALAAWLLLLAAVPAPTPPPREAVRAWRVAHEAAIVNELATLVALPNLARDSTGIRRNARR